MIKLFFQTIFPLRFLVIFSFLVFEISGLAFSEEADQYLGDQLEHDPALLEPSAEKRDSEFLMDSKQTIKREDSKEKDSQEGGGYISSEDTPSAVDAKVTDKDLLISEEGFVSSGQYDEGKELVEGNLKTIIKNTNKENKSSLELKFFKDSFEYQNSGSSFNKIFRDPSDSKFPGGIYVGGNRIYPTIVGEFGIGLSGGLGYNSGRGQFSDNSISEARISLWTFPLDLIFLYQLPIFSIAKIGISGGPSAIMLMQNRSDFEHGEKRKNLRQFGTGYFATASAKFNLGLLSSKIVSNFYQQYSITGIYLDLFARMQNYSNFKSKDISISGTSLGVGFSFEYP